MRSRRSCPSARVSQRQIERQIAEIVLAQARRIPVRIVADDRIVLAAGVAGLRRCNRGVPVRIPVVPVDSRGARRCRTTDPGSRFQRDLNSCSSAVSCLRRSAAPPSACTCADPDRRRLSICPSRVDHGQIGARAGAELAAVEPGRTCVARHRCQTSARLSRRTSSSGSAEENSTAPPRLLLRCGIERTRALRQNDALLTSSRGDRAADVQAVVVAVGHVAERHAIEREPQPILVEPAHRDPRRPFVGAIGIGGLEVDAGKILDRLERARSRRAAVRSVVR